MGPCAAEESLTTQRGLRSKPELAGGKFTLVLHSLSAEPVKAHLGHPVLLKPEGFVLPPDRADRHPKTDNWTSFYCLRALPAPLESTDT